MAERRGGSSIMLLLVAVTPPAVAYAPAAALLRPRTAAAVGLALSRVENSAHDNRRAPAALRSASVRPTPGTGRCPDNSAPIDVDGSNFTDQNNPNAMTLPRDTG